mgnify:CR=1 FL=1
MTNSKSQKVGGSQAAGSAKCGAQSSKNKKAAPVCVFENPEFGMVRMATDEKGEPWFCAKDLCDALGYKKASDAVKQHVQSSDTAKRGVARPAKNRFGVCDGKMQNVQMIFVNESGFYALVLGSKLPSAVMFKDWVTSVVLPQIRKTGGYIPVNEGESEEEMIRSAEQILRATLKEKDDLLEKQKKLLEEQKARLDGQKALIAVLDERLAKQKTVLHQQEVQMGLDKKLIGEQDVEIRRLNGVLDEQTRWASIQGENVINLEKQVDGLLPKAIYSDNVLDSVSCFTTTQVAKELGITAQELNRSLCALHIQYYQSGQYMLYAEYAHMGLAKSRTRYNAFLDPKCDGRQAKMGKAVTHTYLVWTEKGRKFIHDLAHRFWELAEMFEVKNLG